LQTADFYYQELCKSRDAKDFWGQVARTVNGKSVGEDQIEMIVATVTKALALELSDVVLDLGCGNGALSNYFSKKIRALVGVDKSQYLIDVAKENFETPAQRFYHDDALQFMKEFDEPEKITKILCYGAFSYFSEGAAEEILKLASSRYFSATTFFIGNLPDKARAQFFNPAYSPTAREVLDSTSAIGLWRSQEEFTRLAERTGWSVQFHQMPKTFFSSHYRYDAILTRPRGAR